MPQCPSCKADYEIGRRYCAQCDSYLLNPEEGDHFCPQCGVRVASLQEICHKCNAALPAKAAAAHPTPAAPPPPAPEPPPPHMPQIAPPGPPTGLPAWALGTLIGAGVIIVVLLLVILFRQGPSPTQVAEIPTPKAVTPAPQEMTPPAAPAAKEPAAPSAPAPAPPTATTPATPATQPSAPPAALPAHEPSLADQVKETLNNLRQAQLKNDIILFMSCYSYIYPSLDKKRKQTLSYWDDFNFAALEFSLDEVKPLGQDSALAKVTWSMQVQNRDSQQFDNFTQTFEVVLAKELGKWRIRSLKDLEEE